MSETGLASVSPRLIRARRVAGFCAAATMLLYLAVKAAWVIGALAGLVLREFDSNVPEWIALNIVTIGMAALGVALGLALAQPWGMRQEEPPGSTLPHSEGGISTRVSW